MASTAYQLGGYGSIQVPNTPITSPRDPISHQDILSPTGVPYQLGQFWENTTSLSVFQFLGGGVWAEISQGTGGPITTLTGNTGGPIPPTAGNINILGSGPITVSGSGSTLTITGSASGFPVTPFVVGPIGQAGYQTIQSAINAAFAAGSGIVVVQPGTYTENLTLRDGIHIMGLTFADAGGGVIINGTHTPPTTGGFVFRNVALNHATAIFTSIAAGSAHLVIGDAAINVTNGYTFNLPNWTGKLESFDVNAAIGTADGYVNNIGGAEVDIFECSVGSGTANPMIVSGFTLGAGANFYCPVNFTTGSTAQIDYSDFNKAISFLNNSTGEISSTRISTGSSAAITMSSSASWTLTNCTIISSNNPSIAGAGAGTLTLGSITFLSNKLIANTLTVAWAITKLSAITPFVVSGSGNAAYQTIQSAINAANAAGGGLVFVQSGTYTENLTFFDKIALAGVSEQDTTIVGIHTPPSTGTLNIDRCTFSSATSIFSSNAAGTSTIIIEDCTLSATSGYAFDLPNWTAPGSIGLFNLASFGANDGGINNTGGASVFAFSVGMGSGGSNVMNLSGTILWNTSEFGAPISLQTGSVFTFDYCSFAHTVTCANNSTGTFSFGRFSTGASPSLTMSSSAAIGLTDCIINSSNNPAITGAGAGTLTLGTMTFLNNALLAGTLTTAWATTRTGADIITGNLTFSDSGNKIISSNVGTTTTAGANSFGSVTLVGGTATVSTTSVTANSLIFIWRQSIGATGANPLGLLTVGTITASTSFVINAVLTATATTLVASDVSVVGWMIVN